MKKYLFLAVFFSICGMAHADQPRQLARKRLPAINAMVSQGVYISTYINTVSAPGGVVIASYPCIVHVVNVSSAGEAGSTFEFFDSMATTGTLAIPGDKIAHINAESRISWPYDVFLDSGLAINNFSLTVPAKVTIIYRLK